MTEQPRQKDETMRVTKLKLRNFRGINREFELPAACVVAGPNFSGKSTVPIALRLACVGSMPPPIGKTGIWPAFAGNPDDPGVMSVTATTDGGLTWSLEWERKKESVSQRGQPPVECALPPVLCDPSTFWTMTGAEQSRAIFAASGASVDPVCLLDAVRSVEAMPARIRDEAVEHLCTLLVNRTEANPDVSAATALWVSDAGQIAKEERAKAKRLEAKASAAFWSGPLPVDKSKELAEARRELAAANVRVNEYARASKAAEKVAELNERRLRRIAELDAAMAEAATPEPHELSEAMVEEFARVEDKYNQNTEARQVLERDLEAKNATLAALRNGRCPCCGQSGESLASIIAALETETASLTTRLTDTSNEGRALFDRLTELGQRNDRMARKHREWEQKLKDVESLRRERSSLSEMAHGTAEPAPTPEAIAEATNTAATLAERVQELEGAQAEFARWSVLRDERDKAESELIRARCFVEVATNAQKRVSAVLDEVSGKAFSETLAIANRLCDGLLASPLEFRNGMLGRAASKTDVERTGGTVRAGSWIPHTSFSGTEALIGYAGFAVAVASKAPFRLVVMDELNRLTADRKRSLISRIMLLIREGVIDQFVGCDPEASESFTLIDVARWEF